LSEDLLLIALAKPVASLTFLANSPTNSHLSADNHPSFPSIREKIYWFESPKSPDLTTVLTPQHAPNPGPASPPPTAFWDIEVHELHSEGIHACVKKERDDILDTYHLLDTIVDELSNKLHATNTTELVVCDLNSIIKELRASIKEPDDQVAIT
jgi:hypothetical protein